MTNNLGKIHVLDTLTASQIAAGEVVERPMSVVKELVENAMDAGAKRITVKIEGGGLDLIQVIDDGCGMEPVDMERAFLRHATSKISSAADIIGVATLGFRGEAMPSIASVSKVVLKSRPATSTSGYEVFATGETVTPRGECGMPKGTVVTVSDLFYNTPVRKKFLKKPGAESGMVGDLIARFILARPDIAFVFQEDGKTTLHSPGTGSLQQSIMAVYDRDILSNMLEITPNPLLNGMLSRPGIHRATRSYYNFFINDRWVKCKELTKAVDIAYATLNPKGRYAIVVLAMTLPPEAVDVNVHPAKLEVRFRDWPSLRQKVLDLLAETLLGKPQPVLLQQNTVSLPPILDEPSPIIAEEHSRTTLPEGSMEQILYQTPVPAKKTKPQQTLLSFGAEIGQKTIEPVKPAAGYVEERNGDMQRPLVAEAPVDQSRSQMVTPLREEQVEISADSAPLSVAKNPVQKAMSVAPLAAAPLPEQRKVVQQQALQPQLPGFPWCSLKVLGQMKGMYILAEGDDGLYIIDQHAAHERLRYEGYKRRFLEKQQQITQLTLPVSLSLSHKQKKTLVSQIEAITAMGFLVEYFGDNDFLLRGVPGWYEEGNAEELLLSILDTIGEEESFDTVAFCADKLFSLACHSAVRANDHLTPGDISWLLRQLEEAHCAFTCPHGRPIAIKLGFEDISRRFYRS